MKKWSKCILFCVLLMGMIYVSAFYEKRKALPDAADRIYALSQIWKNASEYYAFWDQTDDGLDWDAEYQYACDRALQAGTAYEYYCVLQEFTAKLKDNHADILLSAPETVEFGRLPFHVQYIEDQYVVDITQDGNKAPLGAVLYQINGQDTEEYLEEVFGTRIGLQTELARQQKLAELFIYKGEIGEKLKLEFYDSSRIIESTIKRQKFYSSNSVFRLERNIPYKEQVYVSEAFELYKLENDLVYLNVKGALNEEKLREYENEVIGRMERGRGVIVDLRFSTGGNAGIGNSILGNIVNKELPPGKFKTTITAGCDISLYKGNPDAEGESWWERGFQMDRKRFQLTSEQYAEFLNTVLNQPGEYIYDLDRNRIEKKRKEVPAAVLISHTTGSAIDNCAASLKSAGIPLVGTRTSGGTGMVLPVDLGNGWTWGFSINHPLTPEGEEINNHGVKASYYVEQKYDDFLNEIDSQLVFAMDLLKGIEENP